MFSGTRTPSRDSSLTNNNFYSLTSSSDSNTHMQEPSSQSNVIINNNSSYSSLKTKIKAVQEKYRKSSMSDKIRSKFGKPNRSSAWKTSTPDGSTNLEGMTKFLSYSHGALADLDQEFNSVSLIHHKHSQQTKRRNGPSIVSFGSHCLMNQVA